jgi:hypothetical protein
MQPKDSGDQNIRRRERESIASMSKSQSISSQLMENTNTLKSSQTATKVGDQRVSVSPLMEASK